MGFLKLKKSKGITKQPLKSPWKILVVDDEDGVHSVTRIVLEDLVFDGRGIDIFSAYSAEEAKGMISNHPDIAVVLLDVVMEEENSGLEVVKCIRNDIRNNFMRIILRTGQPGQAPEKEIILGYDINDYKEKSELTSQKLYTAVVAALRSYRDIMTIESHKEGLSRIIDSNKTIFRVDSLRKFSEEVIAQLVALIEVGQSELGGEISGLAATLFNNDFTILAGKGQFEELTDQNAGEVLPSEIVRLLHQTLHEKQSLFGDKYYVGYFESFSGEINIIYLEEWHELTDWDRKTIEILCSNLNTAYNNIYLNREIIDTQKEILFTLSEVAEARSQETSNHVKRVVEYARIIAFNYGLSEEEAELVKMATAMHDIGKLAIPDSILNKPGKLTPEEFEIMKTHPTLGYEMLKNSKREILRASAIIAHEHQEKYNGAGYPRGLKGDEIHLYARITAISDVFDALSSVRVYKPAWELERIIEYFQKERGEHFDPQLVDVFLNSLDEILAVKERYKDKSHQV